MQELKEELKIMITNNAETAKKFERQIDKRLEKLKKKVNTEEQENEIAEMEAKLVMIEDRLKGNTKIVNDNTPEVGNQIQEMQRKSLERKDREES